MPAIFIYALIGFAVLVVLIVVLLMVFAGLRPSRRSSIGASSPNDTSMSGWGS
jgi:hypothetical protein